jgi:DNA-binding NtrC family response regulator
MRANISGSSELTLCQAPKDLRTNSPVVQIEPSARTRNRKLPTRPAYAGHDAEMPGARDGQSRPPPQTTIVRATENGAASGRATEELISLVIAWCAHDPSRVGEIAFLPGGSEKKVTLGRGDEAPDQNLRFFRQRPSGLTLAAPLQSPGVSRRQLLIGATHEELRIELVGKCALEINGERCEVATVRPGDLVYLRHELLLVCVRRIARIPPLQYFPRTAVGQFGQADTSGILGESPAVWRLRERIAFAAIGGKHVLLTGESGTGKELAARAIHALSTRASSPLVARNAATLPAGLIDAELFGNARNYPNGGMPERPGLIGHADSGYLFLDEIGELPSELQAHLLRVLDRDGEYQRLGEAQSRRADFRLIGATNRDPGLLKHDLLARLTTRVDVPALDERREDIPLLANHLLLRAADTSPAVASRFIERTSDGQTYPRASPALIAYLLRRTFTTNTRELEAVLWQAMAESHANVVELPRSLPGTRRAATEASASAPSANAAVVSEPTADEIRVALARGGGLARVARSLGLSSRYVLYRLLDKHGITRPAR